MSMSENELNRIVNNDAEWRKYLIGRIERIEDKQDNFLVTMTTLKVKYGVIGSIFGTIGGLISAFVVSYLTKK